MASGLAAPLAVAVGLGAQTLGRRLSTVISGRARWPISASNAISAGAFGLLFLAVGIGSASTYLLRPVADRYYPFAYDVVAMAQLSRPGTDAVIVDEFGGYAVRFLRDPAPALFAPGKPVDLTGIDRVLARTREELGSALGAVAGASAVPVAWDPLGEPTVWAATP